MVLAPPLCTLPQPKAATGFRAAHAEDACAGHAMFGMKGPTDVARKTGELE